MKKVKIVYNNQINDLITNINSVKYDKNDNTFFVLASDSVSAIVVPRENVRYVHITEEPEAPREVIKEEIKDVV